MEKNFDMPCLQLFGCLIWVLWQEQNGTLHGSSSRSTSILVSGLEYMFGDDTEKTETRIRPQQGVLIASHDFMRSHEPGKKDAVSFQAIPGDRMIRWQTLRVHFLKLNTDVLICGGSRQIGTRGIIRDHHGHVMAVFARTFIGSFEVVEAELIALREGLEFANSLNYQLEAVEVDYLSIVRELESDFTFSPLAELLHDVSTLIKLCRGPCQYIPCEGNCVAHELALGSFSLSHSYWTNCIPLFSLAFIFGEI
ncbi:uncharacterized protein Fot_13859 [Forsythia ovata]|uniref:RNase H type-1 domain-containing protein n=1 Tax=Forsythia ovata TaxID=205694 RepID=A0ABD1W539_9LAMI